VIFKKAGILKKFDLMRGDPYITTVYESTEGKGCIF
jgi:hypothetical protein